MVNVKKNISILLVGIIVYFFLTSYRLENYGVIATFLLIIFFTARGVFSCSNVNYGLSQVFYLFSLFFLGIAPLYQYLEGVVFWGAQPFNADNYLQTNLTLILALLVYEFTYKRVFKGKKIESIINYGLIRPWSVSSYVLLILSLISSLYIFVVIFHGNVMGMLIRSSSTDTVAGGALIHLFFIRPMPAICFLLFKYYKKSNRIVEFVLFLLMCVTNSPIAIPRFAVAAFYIPLAFIYIRALQKQYNFALFMTFALLVIFPLLHLVRASVDEFSIASSFSMMLEGHFDSYQMLMQVVSTEYITWGRQLLGVILFFVPRGMWASKPIGSGYLIAHENDYYFDNISMNYFGEGYVNFGIIGVVLFAVVIGYFNARMDKKYWLSLYQTPLFVLVFAVTLGMEFVIMRGALLNMLPVYIGYVLAIRLAYRISRVRL